jgi:glutathione peroxidase
MRRLSAFVVALAAAGIVGSLGVTARSRADDAPAAPPDLYALDCKSLEGQPAPLSAWRGKVTLVVNVASQCGFTPQYQGLQALHDRLKDRGFSVLGFPSNEFGGQEPGTPAEIRGFCDSRYHVTFPMFEKCVTARGDAQSPVYHLLSDVTHEVPSWNFCKYLVGRDGKPKAFFRSRTTPDDATLTQAIEAALAEPAPAPPAH